MTFDVRGEEFFGEIIELDDGENVALVQLIPTNAFVPIDQDQLRRVENDPMNYREQVSPNPQTQEPPAPGELF